MLARWEKTRSTSMRDHFSSTRSNQFAGVVEPLLRGICSVGTQSDLKHLMILVELSFVQYRIVAAASKVNYDSTASFDFHRS